MFAKKTYFVGSRFPRLAKGNDLAINTTTNTINYRGPDGWVAVGGVGETSGTFDDPILKDNVRFTNSNDDVRLRIEHGGTGVVRIHAPEDDLALRSANDILLYAGDDGPGNVYIGWGDATYTPDASNRVATIADIQDANTGDITFVDNTISSETGDDIIIQNKNGSDVVKARISLDQSNEQVLIEAIAENNDWFNDTQWDTAVWSGAVVTITNTPDIITFFDTIPGNVTRVSINNGSSIAYEGASYGDGSIAINVDGSPFAEEDPLTITEIRFYYSLISKIDIDNDGGSFDIISKAMSMTIDSSGDLELNARDEDIDIRARDDIRFTTNWGSGGTEPEWRMTNSGRFELPGAGYIENLIESSSDYSGYDTIKIVPDVNLLENNILNADQYIIIDPTAPNHIHIRAGGTIDASTADLIIGGEDTNLLVSDTGDYVDIRTTSVDSDSYVYRFDSSGYFTGPAMGGLFVSGLLNGENDLWLGSNTNVVLSPGTESAAFVGDTSNINNQIATLGDLPSGVTSSFNTATHTITVTNGIITAIDAL